MEYFLTPHALFEMKRRGIDERTVRKVLLHPEQRFSLWAGREVCQSKIDIAGKTYLVRVFIEKRFDKIEVVTVYLTSKISKYWRTQT